MTILQTCCKFIKVWEGCKLFPYRDQAGYPTVGYGKLLSRDLTIPLTAFEPITLEEAEEHLVAEVSKTIGRVLKLTQGADLTEGQLVGLTSFAFNLGSGALQASTLRKCILRNDSQDRITQEFRKWNKAGGIKRKGLVRRREAELKVFFS